MESGSYLDRPGDEYNVRFQFAFSTWQKDFSIPTPYLVIFELADAPQTPVKYENWT